MPISKVIHALIHLSVLKAQNLLDIIDLDVFCERFAASFANIQQFSAEWEDAIIVAADDRKARDRQRFGGISFGKDQSAASCVSGTRIVGIFELGDTDEPLGVRIDASATASSIQPEESAVEPCLFSTVGLLQILVLLVLSPSKNIIDDTRTGHYQEEEKIKRALTDRRAQGRRRLDTDTFLDELFGNLAFATELGDL
jgi:hypothetical protein